MTTRIDHTNCSHDATPAARKWCRDNRRDAIRQAQHAYLDCEEGKVESAEYYAIVELLSYTLGVSLDEAYEIVENGPSL